MQSETNNCTKYVDVTKHIKFEEKLKVVSLFSGCGGMDLGFKGDFNYLDNYFEENPFEIIYANDIKQPACKTYSYNFKHDAICGDIKEIDINSIPQCDIVIGGFPCQDFSLAGKRQGFLAERGRLYLEMKKVIEKLSPKAFIAENVDGIRNNTVDAENSALDIIINDFNSIGYKTTYKVVNASNYGVPQNRIRVIIMGIREDIFKGFNYPLETYGEQANQKKILTAKDAIDDLWNCLGNTEIPNHTEKDYSKAKFYPRKKTSRK